MVKREGGEGENENVTQKVGKKGKDVFVVYFLAILPKNYTSKNGLRRPPRPSSHSITERVGGSEGEKDFTTITVPPNHLSEILACFLHTVFVKICMFFYYYLFVHFYFTLFS